MALLDSQKEETISKLILNTVPVVDKKIREQKYEARLRAKKANKVDESLVLKRRNQESRMINYKEVARSKELITTMKLHNSMHLKQSKKINE
jgi:basic membrane lipoprotein Med (substrate-binding protein (PBP1-ABC) superfamily)